MEKTHTHALTPTQHKYVSTILEQHKELQRQLQFFLAYIVDENSLPKTTNGYGLSPDGASLTGELTTENK